MLINFEVVSASGLTACRRDQAILVEVRQGGRETSKEIFRLEAEVEQQLKGRGMTIVKDVDLAAFRKAGEKAYEVLKIMDAKAAVHKEIGKN
jgi:TRAP-type C4-dicarboxylate transport system substrate-binding protein